MLSPPGLPLVAGTVSVFVPSGAQTKGALVFPFTPRTVTENTSHVSQAVKTLETP
jgi:hypothetical protein